MCALRFCKRSLIVAKFAKKTTKIGQEKNNFPKILAWWHHIYAEKAYRWHKHASGFSTCNIRQRGALRSL